jgi:hypothetical protein
MAPRKTKFDLEFPNINVYKGHSGSVDIIGEAPEHKPYVSFTVKDNSKLESRFFIHDEDMELFAINILKALKSKHLRYGKPARRKAN